MVEIDLTSSEKYLFQEMLSREEIIIGSNSKEILFIGFMKNLNIHEQIKNKF